VINLRSASTKAVSAALSTRLRGVGFFLGGHEGDGRSQHFRHQFADSVALTFKIRPVTARNRFEPGDLVFQLGDLCSSRRCRGAKTANLSETNGPRRAGRKRRAGG
jgi:hypothetical protein